MIRVTSHNAKVPKSKESDDGRMGVDGEVDGGARRLALALAGLAGAATGSIREYPIIRIMKGEGRTIGRSCRCWSRSGR